MITNYVLYLQPKIYIFKTIYLNYYFMVTQKMISVKLDVDQLRELDFTCSKLGINRNKFLNFLVSFGNSMLKDVSDIRLLHAYNFALNGFND